MRHSCAAIWGSAQPIWEADFRSLTLGDPGTLPGGLSFSRSGSGRSVQTSASTIMLSTGKSFNSANNPRCGQPRGLASRGLVLSQGSENVAAIVGYSDPQTVISDLRDVSNASDFLGPGSGATFTAGTGSPDGVATARRVQITSGGYARYRYAKNAKGGSQFNNAYLYQCFSTWQKTSGLIQQLQGTTADNVTVPYNATARTGSGAWERVATVNAVPAANNLYKFMFVAFAGDGTIYGGLPAAAQDVEIDLLQVEPGRFPTDWMPPNSGRDRGPEYLWHPTRTTQIIGGRLCLELTFSPYGASNEYDYQVEFGGGGGLPVNTQIHLWWVDASNRGWFDPTTRQITTRINAVDYTHPTALTWAQGDTIQVWIEAGNGTPRASYRVSGNDEVSWGTAVALGTGASQASLPGGAGTLDFLCRTTSSDVFTSYIKAIRVFDNERPSWVV